MFRCFKKKKKKNNNPCLTLGETDGQAHRRIPTTFHLIFPTLNLNLMSSLSDRHRWCRRKAGLLRRWGGVTDSVEWSAESLISSLWLPEERWRDERGGGSTSEMSAAASSPVEGQTRVRPPPTESDVNERLIYWSAREVRVAALAHVSAVFFPHCSQLHWMNPVAIHRYSHIHYDTIKWVFFVCVCVHRDNIVSSFIDGSVSVRPGEPVQMHGAGFQGREARIPVQKTLTTAQLKI